MTENRIHTRTLTRARAHIDRADGLVRSATLAATAVQVDAAAKALTELRAAVAALETVAPQ